MDPGSYEDLAGRLYGLLIGLEGRLNSDDASIIHQFIDARHCGLALEEIARDAGAPHDRLARPNRTPLKGELARVAVRACPTIGYSGPWL